MIIIGIKGLSLCKNELIMSPGLGSVDLPSYLFTESPTSLMGQEDRVIKQVPTLIYPLHLTKNHVNVFDNPFTVNLGVTFVNTLATSNLVGHR